MGKEQVDGTDGNAIQAGTDLVVRMVASNWTLNKIVSVIPPQYLPTKIQSYSALPLCVYACHLMPSYIIGVNYVLLQHLEPLPIKITTFAFNRE